MPTKEKILAAAVLATAIKPEIIRPRFLPQFTGLSRTSIWRLERAGKFVPKIRLSTGAIGYRRTDIERWLEELSIVNGEG